MTVDSTEVYISIHAPTRGATLHVANCYNDITFQSTLPREERQYLTICHRSFRIQFQSTLPREERRFRTKTAREDLRISIHAPTRGATQEGIISTTKILISIHAPTRGATAILHKKFVYFYTIPTINI